MKVSEHVTVSSEAIIFSVSGNVFSSFSGDFLCVAVKLFIRNPHTPTEVNSKVSRCQRRRSGLRLAGTDTQEQREGVGREILFSKFNSQVQITNLHEARSHINKTPPNEQRMHERRRHGRLNRPTASLSITPVV